MLKQTALALVFGVSSISAAVAADDGITKTLENNTYQQTSSINCASATRCNMAFPLTTATMTEITNISCSLYPLLNGVQILAASLSDNTDPTYPTFYVPTFVTGGNSAVFAVGINSSTKLFLKQNEQPNIRITFITESDPANLLCTITGYHS